MKIGPSPEFLKKFKLSAPKGGSNFKPSESTGGKSRLATAMKKMKK